MTFEFLPFFVQEDFEEFSNPDELYSALQLEKVESLDDFAIASTTLVKVPDLYLSCARLYKNDDDIQLSDRCR